MTVTSEISRVDPPYAGNGVTTVFPYTFKIFAAGDLRVILTDPEGVETTLVLGVDYTVSGAGSAAGGNVTTTVAPATDYTLSIERVLAPTQPVDLRNQGPFLAEVVERVADRLTMLAQQALAQSGSALRLPKGEAATDLTTLLPPLADRKGNVFGWDPTTGAPGAYSPLSGATVSAAMIAVVQAATLEIARALLIEDGQLANSKLADMATQRIKGRTTTGDGEPEDLTVAQVLTMLGFDPVAVSRSVAAPNATTPAHKIAAAGSEVNIDLVLSPKGSGAISRHTPNNLVTGGNKRGEYAVDFQYERDNKEQVASGIHSGLIATANCTASGLMSFAAASSFCRVEGSSSAAISANGADIEHTHVLASGTGPISKNDNSRILARDAGKQFDEFFLQKRTTTATPSALLDYTLASIEIDQMSCILGEARIIALDALGTQVGAYIVRFCAHRQYLASSVAMVGSVVKEAFETAGASAWDISVAADTTNGGINITATGAAATTIDWHAYVSLARSQRALSL